MVEAQHAAVYERFKARLKTQVAGLLGPSASDHNRQLHANRKVLEGEIRQGMQQLLAESRGLTLSLHDQERMLHDLVEEIVGLGPLDPLLEDASISEIMINGPQEIFIERNGVLQRVEAVFRNEHHLMATIERLLDTVGLSVNEANPICDANLADGSRINVIIPPLVLNGPVVTIRRAMHAWTMANYVTAGALSAQAAQFLEGCVKAKVNLVISGGTSTGKTTLVTILSAFIPPGERIITIENVAELKLLNREHWIRLVGKSANMDGRGEIPLRLLVRNALRMRPDRLILGEARGGEALDVVQAMHTGHDGVITVLHANSPQAALERFQTLMLMSDVELPPQACLTQVASAVDLIIHLARYADGTRRIASIAQVLDSAESAIRLEELFAFDVKGFRPDGTLEGELRYTGVRPMCLSKFQMNNIPIPTWMA